MIWNCICMKVKHTLDVRRLMFCLLGRRLKTTSGTANQPICQAGALTPGPHSQTLLRAGLTSEQAWKPIQELCQTSCGERALGHPGASTSMSQTYKNWIGDWFDGQVISFTDETKWQVEKKICEKCFYFHSSSSDSLEFSEASAVYHCRQVEGATVGKEAIMKVRLQ